MDSNPVLGKVPDGCSCPLRKYSTFTPARCGNYCHPHGLLLHSPAPMSRDPGESRRVGNLPMRMQLWLDQQFITPRHTSVVADMTWS